MINVFPKIFIIIRAIRRILHRGHKYNSVMLECYLPALPLPKRNKVEKEWGKLSIRKDVCKKHLKMEQEFILHNRKGAEGKE